MTDQREQEIRKRYEGWSDLRPSVPYLFSLLDRERERSTELLRALEYVLEWGEDPDELGIQWPDVEDKARAALAKYKTPE